MAGHVSPARAVIGGSDTTAPGFMAFVVAQSSTGEQACTGTAIRPNVILTAAHCVVDHQIDTYVAPSKVFATVGQQNPRSGLENRTAPVNPIMNYITPKGYRGLANGVAIYDVALLQVRDAMPQTVSLIPPDRTDLWGPAVHSSLLGWGLTLGGDATSVASNLQLGTLTVDTSSNCARRVLGFSSVLMLCSTTSGPAQACQGDSGGPLLASDPATGTEYQIGVSSFGAAHCDPGSSSFFANVAAPTLGNFVDTYATQLQQAAENTPPKAPAPSTPPAPVPTPAPPASPTASTFTLLQAISRIDVAIGNVTQAQEVARYGCARKTKQTFRCVMTWRGRIATYRGSMFVSATSIRFEGHRATRRCQRRHSFTHCARPFEFSV